MWFNSQKLINKLKQDIKARDNRIKILYSFINRLRSKNNLLLNTNNTLREERDKYLRDIASGKLINPPCELGSKVYWITNAIYLRYIENYMIDFNNDNGIGIVCFTVDKFVITDRGLVMQFKETYKDGNNFSIHCSFINKNVFFNKEDAYKIFNNLDDYKHNLGFLY